MNIATITLNPAFDLVGRMEHITLGGVNAVQTLGVYPAGKGINVAKVLSDLGVTGIMLGGLLGQENSAAFEQHFATLNVIDRMQRIAGSTRTNVKLTASDGEVTDLNFSGFTVSAPQWQQFCDDSVNYLRDVQLVAVCGSLPRGVSAAMFAQWLSAVRALGVKVVLDSSKAALNAGMQTTPWLVKPNEHELAEYMNVPLKTLDEIIDAAQALHTQGIENVVVSMGEKGALWVSEYGVFHAQPPRCERIVSTVGAGDSMVAGFIYGLSQQWSPQEVFACASALGTLAVMQENVGLTDRQQLNDMMKKVTIQRKGE
ncbi:1-phosphofructokinase [Pasteurellaceae bacterium HPA106]|uniref:1-phosphofructokinase n=1 Tax=Spirabiliibacterium pneumoniae TaxID=221400 RepID=UPI001AAD7E2F|nr:1-phosphofructokinase [Spirabiliibacterium pneumoniae]MBE2896017.1 1-phosphofructokinase [Spirabiliibacterium pneumoniae]